MVGLEFKILGILAGHQRADNLTAGGQELMALDRSQMFGTAPACLTPDFGDTFLAARILACLSLFPPSSAAMKVAVARKHEAPIAQIARDFGILRSDIA